MQYRDMGRLGYRASALGFGAMRLPAHEDGTVDLEQAVPLLKLGIDLGINYLDTAHGYLEGTSEIAVGQAVRQYDRGKLLVSTKVPPHDKDGAQWRREFDESFKRLDIGYVDFIHMHYVNWESYNKWVDVPGGALEQARRVKEEGLAHHISFSFHGDPADLIKLIDTGNFDLVTLQYNLLDRANEEGIAYAAEKGLAVVVMGPVGGGRLGFTSENIQALIPGGVKSTPEIAIRFVLANPGVSVALSGMSAPQHVTENVATADRAEALSAAELEQVRQALAENEKLAQLYCTGCNYCMPCPNEVNIPDNFRLMNYHRVYGLVDLAKERYQKLVGKGQSAEACQECGQCEPKCPQRIAIIDQLVEVRETLGS
ncbi:MAG: aldo/keto reductase [Anaerolineae bacterium]